MSFAPANRNAGQSTDEIDVYVRTSGNTTDTLTLTRPGNSGQSFRYRYVGAGFWQRTINEASVISGTFDGFTYGVETPDASLVCTGIGNFTTEMLGVIAFSDSLAPFRGSGVLSVEFGTGAIDLNGTYSTVDTTTGLLNSADPYYGSATLSSTSNAFAGHITIGFQESELKGRFFGPNAEELGATFGSGSGLSVAGTLIGRRAGTASDDGLLAINGDRSFNSYMGFYKQSEFIEANYVVERDANGNAMIVPSSFAWAPTDIVANLDTSTYQFLENNNPVVGFTQSDLVVGESNAQFSVYRKATGGMEDELLIAKPGSPAAAGSISLTYASYGRWAQRQPALTPGNTKSTEVYFAYGLRTDPTIFPKSGTASYEGILLGGGLSIENGQASYNVGGTFEISANFTNNSIAGTMLPILTNMDTLGVTNFINPLIITGAISSTSYVAYSATFTDSNVNSIENYFSGQFFGPTASEVSGVFSGNVGNPSNPAEVISIRGAAAGKKVP